jgi:hypothetical protein
VLTIAALRDKADYLYQVNDDSHLSSAGWAAALTAKLRGNPFLPNLGVTGPTDTKQGRIFTHVFVHRTHFEIFGYLFPPAFKNWWSDDWISHVYGGRCVVRVVYCADLAPPCALVRSALTRIVVAPRRRLRPPRLSFSLFILDSFSRISLRRARLATPSLLAPDAAHRANSATFMDDGVEVDHRTGAQKKSSTKIERYQVDRADAGKLEGELRDGRTKIKAWLSASGHSVPMHVTCGYTGEEA